MVPATVVSADFMNLAVQNEGVNLVEGAGLTLSKVDDSQWLQAVQALIGAGGGSQLKQSVLNNVAATAITGLSIDKLTHSAMQALVAIERKTDTQNEQENGILRVTYDQVADLFVVDFQSSHDDAGLTFTVTAAGQVEYASDDLTGTSYTGDIRITQIVKFDL